MAKQTVYYEDAQDAVAAAVEESRDDGGTTFWVTLQPSGWCVDRRKRCPDIRSVPVWRVRDGKATRLMEYPH